MSKYIIPEFSEEAWADIKGMFEEELGESVTEYKFFYNSPNRTCDFKIGDDLIQISSDEQETDFFIWTTQMGIKATDVTADDFMTFLIINSCTIYKGLIRRKAIDRYKSEHAAPKP